MGRRIEMPPKCVRCETYNPEYGDWCRKCLPHQRWLQAITQAWESDQVRVRGHLFEIHPPVSEGFSATGGRGFGGAEFKIKFKDGRTVVTQNLWSVGDIPEEYRNALPDNAKFIYERRWPPPSEQGRKKRKP